MKRVSFFCQMVGKRIVKELYANNVLVVSIFLVSHCRRGKMCKGNLRLFCESGSEKIKFH